MMKSSLLVHAVLSFSLPLAALHSGIARGADKPNIVFIFIDDLGWKDIGCYGNDFVETPRLDQLAEEGMRFTDFYAAGAVCSPTRCAVQSGQNQARIGIKAHIAGHWPGPHRWATSRFARSGDLPQPKWNRLRQSDLFFMHQR